MRSRRPRERDMLGHRGWVIDEGVLRAWRVVRGRKLWESADADGRWSRKGEPVIYASCTAALAALEALAHLERADARKPHRLTRIEVAIEPGEVIWLPPAALAHNWRRRRPYTQALGRCWLQQQRAMVLLVPSALASGEMNILINAADPRWPRWERRSRDERFRFDPRLLRGRR